MSVTAMNPIVAIFTIHLSSELLIEKGVRNVMRIVLLFLTFLLHAYNPSQLLMLRFFHNEFVFMDLIFCRTNFP